MLRRAALLLGTLLLVLLGLAAWWLSRPAPSVPPPVAVAPPATATAAQGPRLAICIDDWGYLSEPVRRLRDGLRFPLTTAILPGLPHSVDSAEASFAAGHQVILHCPMQSVKSIGREKGTLLVGMTPAEARAALAEHWAAVPHLSGLNNHEGSAASADRALMDVVAAFLKEKNAFFLDSVTTPNSVIPAAAKAAGILWARRRIFLDNVDKASAVAAQFQLALDLAKRNGSCIAIGHPRKATLDTLERLAPTAAAQGVTLVKVGDLVHP